MRRCEICGREKKLIALDLEFKGETLIFCYDCLVKKTKKQNGRDGLWFFNMIREMVEEGLAKGVETEVIGLKLSFKLTNIVGAETK